MEKQKNGCVRTTFFILILIFFFLFLIQFFHISYPISITTTTKTSELSVVGEGKVEVVPDTAYVDLGISVNNAMTVEEAQKNIDDVNNKIIIAMKLLGIEKTNIKTSNYSIYPNYDYSGQNRIIGYNGNVTITIKATDTQKMSKVIEEGIKAGANQVQGTRFTLDDPDKYRKEAREKAIKNAKQHATDLATMLKIRLGNITNVVESTDNIAFPMAQTMGAGGAIGGGGDMANVEPGSQTISSVVTLYFEKK